METLMGGDGTSCKKYAQIRGFAERSSDVT